MYNIQMYHHTSWKMAFKSYFIFLTSVVFFLFFVDILHKFLPSQRLNVFCNYSWCWLTHLTMQTGVSTWRPSRTAWRRCWALSWCRPSPPSPWRLPRPTHRSSPTLTGSPSSTSTTPGVTRSAIVWNSWVNNMHKYSDLAVTNVLKLLFSPLCLYPHKISA